MNQHNDHTGDERSLSRQTANDRNNSGYVTNDESQVNRNPLNHKPMINRIPFVSVLRVMPIARRLTQHSNTEIKSNHTGKQP